MLKSDNVVEIVEVDVRIPEVKLYAEAKRSIGGAASDFVEGIVAERVETA